MGRTNTSKVLYKYDKRNYGKWSIPRVTKYDTGKKLQKKLRPEHQFGSKKGGCAGHMKSKHYADVLTTLVPAYALPRRNRKIMQEWAEFISSMGFYCTFMGEAPNNIKWSTNHKKCYSFNIYPIDFPPKGKHLLATHSLIRYLYSHKYNKIPYHTLNLYNRYDLNKWKCLYLAHYSEIKNSDYRSQYGLLHQKYIKTSGMFLYPRDSVNIHERLVTSRITSSFDNDIKTKLPKINGETRPLTEDTYEEYLKHLNWI